jgi:hypothetical protein
VNSSKASLYLEISFPFSYAKISNTFQTKQLPNQHQDKDQAFNTLAFGGYFKFRLQQIVLKINVETKIFKKIALHSPLKSFGTCI